MQIALNTATGGGTQSTTQDPQMATSDNSLSSTSQGSLQSSSSINLFNSANGVSLKPSALSTVKLQASQTSSTNQPVKTVSHHHVNGVLLGIVLAVFVIAIVTFWQTTLAAKSTTE